MAREIDWERIESEYRAGLLSVREIAASQGITHGSINKRAKRDGWDRDLSAKIKAKADTLVSKALVSKAVSKEKADTDKRTVEINAQAIANIRIAHRKDIARTKNLAIKLIDELEELTMGRELFEQLGDLLRKPDDRNQDKLNDIYFKAISMSGRVDSIKKLSDTLKTLIALEREAYGLKTGDGGGDGRDIESGLDPFYGRY